MVNDNIHTKFKKNCIHFGIILFNLFGWQSWFGIPLQTFTLVLAMMCFGFALTNNIRSCIQTLGWQMSAWITSPNILQWG